jgi:outer membrane protein
MRILTALIFICCLLPVSTGAQQRSMDNVWPLQRCVQYAISHNITIKQDSLNARMARYTLLQSQLSQLPSLNLSANYGKSTGRSINPTTNQFENQAYNFMGPSGSSTALLFGWMQVRNTIAKNKYSLEASLADLDQRRNDISLNVANSYLVALLAQEQINISTNQVNLSKAQLDQTKAFAEAGRLPELNVAQLESQLATDSSNLINAIANYNSAVLDLKTLLNLDFSETFSIQAPDVNPGDQMAVMTTPPEEVFKKARTLFGSIKGSELRVRSAEKGLAAAKAGLYPQISMTYQAGTNYASNYRSVSGYNDTVVQGSSFIYSPTNTPIFVNEHVAIPTIINTPFGTQLSNNLRQTAFVSLNVPLFNGWQSQYAVRQAKINLASQQLNEYNTELTLKQNVYKAHNNALNSIQKYNAAKRAEDASKRALEFAKKRYELGLTSTVDLLVTQNTAFAAGANLISAKYDLIFKLKVIDYYMGKELKL